MEEKEIWDKVNEKLQFIYLNTDRCCQDLCEGQECKFKVEEIMELLVDLKSKYEN